MVEVTQSDRQAARDCLAELAGHNWGLEYILDGMDDENETVQAFARHRIVAEQRGKLEGARLALEAAATVAPSKTPSGECETVGQWTRRTLREAIRALDPAKIVGEG